MASAVLDKVGVDILSKAKDLQLRATGQTIAFAGFIKVYKEDVDDVKNDDDATILPVMNEREDLKTLAIKPEQHFTEPPPRIFRGQFGQKIGRIGDWIGHQPMPRFCRFCKNATMSNWFPNALCPKTAGGCDSLYGKFIQPLCAI